MATSCAVGCRCGLDPKLLWLWCRPAAVARIRPLAREPPSAARAALKCKEDKKKKERKITLEVRMGRCDPLSPSPGTATMRRLSTAPTCAMSSTVNALSTARVGCLGTAPPGTLPTPAACGPTSLPDKAVSSRSAVTIWTFLYCEPFLTLC